MSQYNKHALTFVLHLKESLTPSSLWNVLVFPVKASTILSIAYVTTVHQTVRMQYLCFVSTCAQSYTLLSKHHSSFPFLLIRYEA